MKARGLSIALAVVMVLALSSLVFAQGTPTLQTANNPTLGQFLVDSKGMTLYIYTRDTAGVSNCTGNCITAWPALTVPAGTTPNAATGISGKLGTITRSDGGGTQVTYNDLPLYYFAQDKAAGDVKGQALNNVWYVVNPASGPVTTALSAAAQATTGATAAATTAATRAAVATTAATAAATVAPTRAAVAGATATAAAPSTLPTTGGNTSSLVIILLAAGAVALLGGLALGAARRTN